MRCSVVVPTFRREALLERLLEAISHQTLAPEEFEVLICDDARSDTTRRQVERWGRVLACPLRYLYAQRGRAGPAAARNLGWRAALAPVIAFTDDDTIPAPDWLERGLAAMVPGVDAAHGRVELTRPDETGFVTANCFCRREALDRVGGFDERFRAAWREDSDLFSRLLKGGFTVVRATEAVVRHPVRPPRRTEARRAERVHRLDALLYRMQPEEFRAVIGRAAPPAYYASIAGAGVALAGALSRKPVLAALGLAGWVASTALVARRRMNGPVDPSAGLASMAVSSAVVPVLSILRRVRAGNEPRAAFW